LRRGDTRASARSDWLFRAAAATFAASAWLCPSAEAGDRSGSPSLTAQVDAVQEGLRTNVTGSVDIEAPACAVWAVLTTCDRTPSIMPGVRSCRVIARDAQAGRWETRELVGRHPLLPRTETSIIHVEFDPPTFIKFTGIGGDLGKVEAEWEIRSLGEGWTRATYQGHVIAPVHAPSFLVRLFARHDTARVLAAVRRQAASIQCPP
jgi:carbon monoxide dehydrogenase subunit G